MGCLYSKMKIFHFPEKLASLPRDSAAIERPLHIRLKPTNACNHRCSYCAYTDARLQLGKDMRRQDMIPEPKMREIIEDLADMGVGAVTFSGGGDPLVYPHLVMAVNGLADAGVKVASLTNGARLSGELAQAFSARATWLRVSMDGWDGPSYAAYRGVDEGEYARVLENIRAFKRLGGPCLLGVNLVLDEQNHAHLFEITARMKDAGVDSVKYSPCIVSNSQEANNRYHAGIFPRVKELSARATAELAAPGFEIYDSYSLMDEKFAKDYGWCPGLQLQPVIGADLNVYACHDKAYNTGNGLLGSIRDVRFKDFWFADKERFFAIDPSRDCRHHCMANGVNRLVLEYLDIDPGHLEFV